MEVVLQALSQELGVIAQAAREEKISRAQAEYLSLERYYVALTRFQFLRTLYRESARVASKYNPSWTDSKRAVAS
jgi:hypothetical protein